VFWKKWVQIAVFCGEIVVKCVVKRGQLTVAFSETKNMPLSLTLFFDFSTEMTKPPLLGRLL
jgi:hypothetical protein